MHIFFMIGLYSPSDQVQDLHVRVLQNYFVKSGHSVEVCFDLAYQEYSILFKKRKVNNNSELVTKQIIDKITTNEAPKVDIILISRGCIPISSMFNIFFSNNIPIIVFEQGDYAEYFYPKSPSQIGEKELMISRASMLRFAEEDQEAQVPSYLRMKFEIVPDVRIIAEMVNKDYPHSPFGESIPNENDMGMLQLDSDISEWDGEIISFCKTIEGLMSKIISGGNDEVTMLDNNDLHHNERSSAINRIIKNLQSTSQL